MKVYKIPPFCTCISIIFPCFFIPIFLEFCKPNEPLGDTKLIFLFFFSLQIYLSWFGRACACGCLLQVGWKDPLVGHECALGRHFSFEAWRYRWTLSPHWTFYNMKQELLATKWAACSAKATDSGQRWTDTWINACPPLSDPVYCWRRSVGGGLNGLTKFATVYWGIHSISTGGSKKRHVSSDCAKDKIMSKSFFKWMSNAQDFI